MCAEKERTESDKRKIKTKLRIFPAYPLKKQFNSLGGHFLLHISQTSKWGRPRQTLKQHAARVTATLPPHPTPCHQFARALPHPVSQAPWHTLPDYPPSHAWSRQSLIKLLRRCRWAGLNNYIRFPWEWFLEIWTDFFQATKICFIVAIVFLRLKKLMWLKR